MSGDEALSKLLPHLSKKPSKVLGLIWQLLSGSIAQVSGQYILAVLQEVHRMLGGMRDRQDQQLVASSLL